MQEISSSIQKIKQKEGEIIKIQTKKNILKSKTQSFLLPSVKVYSTAILNT